ncbi:MAG TPA: hypothetical protein VM077_01055 [Candidatus Limnocylindrales bacterium]|nr:hypothetical protein [Candidatus Limnocylindrales bacterium]
MPDIFTNSKKNIESKPTPQATQLPVENLSNPPGLFSAYCPNPTGINFANQEPDENIVLFLRRHFITNVPWIVSVLLLLIVPVLIFSISNFFAISFFAIPPQLSFVLVSFYYLFILNFGFLKFINWFYHVGIVTQKRLVDLDVDNILHYHLAETEISDVVDVSYAQRGFFQSFFKYGDVHIQTQAIKANFQFEQCPNPGEVADIITDLRPEEKGEKSNV